MNESKAFLSIIEIRYLKILSNHSRIILKLQYLLLSSLIMVKQMLDTCTFIVQYCFLMDFIP